MQLTIEADSGQLGETTLRLVRPPLLVQHGLFGNGPQAIEKPMRDVLSSNGVLFFRPNFAERNVSGFDQVFDVLPTAVQRVAADFRAGRLDEALRGDEQWRSGETGIKGHKIALTKVDVLAHSMGGVLARWYTTDSIADGGTPEEREIHIPGNATIDPSTIPSGTGPLASEGRYTPMATDREPRLRYRRTDNFKRGDFGSVVVYGSPLRGSPFGNYATHEVCRPGMRAQCFDPPPPLLELKRWAIYFEAQPAFGQQDARTRPDAGAGIYDLSMGSTAYRLLSRDSERVRVHAIGTTSEGSNNGWGLLASVLPGSNHYCPGFSRANSDDIVPIESQLANFPLAYRSRFEHAWHNEQGTLDGLQRRVLRLLVDSPASSADPVLLFAEKFPSDWNCFPLRCGAESCQLQP
ncbi:MAG: hypothetical protein HY699_15975 [Deltaproteobacteria bacterium]|nr:hypothetical protein [Deltaproteobacteria bacterium]